MEIFANRARVLRTKRLILRQIGEEDREAFLDLFTDPSVSKTYMLPEFSSRDAAGPLFDRFRALSAGDEHFIYAVTLDGAAIGFLNDTTHTADSVEMGYVIAPSAQNRGYATEAFSACIGELFRIGFRTVRAGYFEGNDASRRVMEKCGLCPTGESEKLVYRGEEHLCPIMEIGR